MEYFDRENIDKLLEIRQIFQCFPPSKFCAIWYFTELKEKEFFLVVMHRYQYQYQYQCYFW